MSKIDRSPRFVKFWNGVKRIKYWNIFWRNSTKVKQWSFSEWLLFVIFILLMAYSIIELIIVLSSKKEIFPKSQLLIGQPEVFPTRKNAELTAHRLLMALQIVLLVSSSLGIIWLTRFRNWSLGIFVFIIFIIQLIGYLSISGYGIWHLIDPILLNGRIYEYSRYMLAHDFEFMFHFLEVQEEKSCCGIHGYEDWEDLRTPLSMHNFPPPGWVPEECCTEDEKKRNEEWPMACGKDALRKSAKELRGSIYTRGCAQFMRESFTPNYVRFTTVGSILIIVIIFVLVQFYFIWRKSRASSKKFEKNFTAWKEGQTQDERELPSTEPTRPPTRSKKPRSILTQRPLKSEQVDPSPPTALDRGQEEHSSRSSMTEEGEDVNGEIVVQVQMHQQ